MAFFRRISLRADSGESISNESGAHTLTGKVSETLDEAGSPLRVLLLEEHPVILAGLTAIFDAEPDLEICGAFEIREAALEAVAELAPDVIVCGLATSGESEFDFLTLVNGLAVIILTACDDPRVAHRALQLGARGYILTRERCENLVLAVKLVAAGEVYLCGSMVTKMLARVVDGTAEAHDMVTASLTRRELQVFELIGQGFNSRQIADKLRLSRKTVDTYRQHIRSKLGLRDNAEIPPRAIAWVHDPGT